MKDVNTCAAKDCEKPRFLDYYVCAEHFAFYAAPHYTDSMLVNVEQRRAGATPRLLALPRSYPLRRHPAAIPAARSNPV